MSETSFKIPERKKQACERVVGAGEGGGDRMRKLLGTGLGSSTGRALGLATLLDV